MGTATDRFGERDESEVGVVGINGPWEVVCRELEVAVGLVGGFDVEGAGADGKALAGADDARPIPWEIGRRLGTGADGHEQ